MFCVNCWWICIPLSPRNCNLVKQVQPHTETDVHGNHFDASIMSRPRDYEEWFGRLNHGISWFPWTKQSLHYSIYCLTNLFAPSHILHAHIVQIIYFLYVRCPNEIALKVIVSALVSSLLDGLNPYRSLGLTKSALVYWRCLLQSSHAYWLFFFPALCFMSESLMICVGMC